MSKPTESLAAESEKNRNGRPTVTVGSQIRELRRSRGLTLTELAGMVGRSVGNLSELERGVSPINLDILDRIAAELDVSISWFFSGPAPDEQPESKLVVRKKNRRQINLRRSGVREELLSPHLSGQLELIMTTFALSSTQYGSIYSLITLISGFFITFIGPLIDRYDARKFSLAIASGLLISLGILAPMNNLLLVALALLGLRLFGQGLGSSLASITVARYFDKQRGKALSLSQMGYPFYEGLITPLGAFLLGVLSFQNFILLFGEVNGFPKILFVNLFFSVTFASN